MTTDLLHAGFTGTRRQIRGPQLLGLADVIDHVKPDVLHIGDCTGADEAAANIARSIGCTIISHPPIDNTYRAFFDADEELPPKRYHERNRDIVMASAVLIACPQRMYPQPARWSGTWYTIGYCLSRVQYRPLYCIWPDGTVDHPRISTDRLRTLTTGTKGKIIG